jgi:hypothetical protein
VISPGVGIAQSSAPATSSAAKTVPLFDRYMQAGYAATNRRDHQTALIYFKRALDERPDDPYATQAIRNVESYLEKNTASPIETVPSPPTATRGAPVPTVVVPPLTAPAAKPQPTPAKPAATQTSAPKPAPTKPTPPTAPTKPSSTKPAPAKPAANSAATRKPTPPTQLTPPRTLPTAPTPAPTVKPPTATVIVPAERPSEAFSEQQAIALINRWLQAKTEVFAPPYDQQQVLDLTTGELLASLVRPNGVLNWLKANRAYFQYGVQKVESVERFVVARERATMEINVTEERTLYLNGVVDPTRTDFSSQRVRFTFVADNGTWKISDYKTVTGSLLERAILTPTNAGIQ